MYVYSLKKDNKIEKIKEVSFNYEREIQRICEDNIRDIFGLELVKSEFSIKKFRIDTLAFDPESKSFVIIEYKRDRNFSVVDQGYAYLSLLSQNQAEFILEYREKLKKDLSKSEVDWSQTKVIFVAPFFTPYQKQAINFKGFPIELWEIRRYENGVLIFNEIEPTDNAVSIEEFSNYKENKVFKEFKNYTEEEKLKWTQKEVKDIYYNINEYIMSLNGVRKKVNKFYIAFIRNYNFCDIIIQKSNLKIYLNLKYGELYDYKNISRNVKGIGHLGNGEYEIIVDEKTDLEYLFGLIKQSYEKN
ncbi:MAG TPA: DUF5655 domain-containing protein, partial [Elusimicrobiales bacterium]|nr:DUF5655 domain-containing protein [Elusimicrobiales bacterium]